MIDNRTIEVIHTAIASIPTVQCEKHMLYPLFYVPDEQLEPEQGSDKMVPRTGTVSAELVDLIISKYDIELLLIKQVTGNDTEQGYQVCVLVPSLLSNEGIHEVLVDRKYLISL